MAPIVSEKKRKASIVEEDVASDSEDSLNGDLEGVLSESEDESDDDDFGGFSSSESGDNENDDDDDLESDDVPSEDETDGKALSKLTLDGEEEAKDEEEEEEEEEEVKPNYRVTTDANGGVRYVYDEIDPVYDSDDSAKETSNTIGNIPLSFYDSYPHIGYDINGKKIMRPAAGEALDALLDSIEVPHGWTGKTDPATGKPLELTHDERELLYKMNRRPGVDNDDDIPYDAYADTIEYFTSKTEIMPLSAAPEPKRRFVPSKHEAVRVAKLVRAIREGRILPYKPQAQDDNQEDDDEEEAVDYDLWKDEQPREADIMHIPAPKLPPPGHSESINCPPEYVPTAEERDEWEKQDPEDRELPFLPTKHDSLRRVPGYAAFVKERFERCLDLYLAPRIRRNRLQIDPNSMLPKLPPAEELKPFPTVCQTVFRGHRGAVRAVAIDPTGRWLASGGSDGTVRVWELLTGRQVWSVKLNRGTKASGGDDDGEPVQCLAWRPTKDVCVLAAGVGEDLFLLVPTAIADPVLEEASRKVVDVGFGYQTVEKKKSNGDSNGEKTKAPAATWTRPEDARLVHAGVLLQVRVRAPIQTVNWHRRGDHFCTVSPTGARSATIIHTLSRHASQVPFRRVANIPQAAQFHPTRPLFFLATKQRVRVYDLSKMEMVKTLQPGARQISSIDVHPSGTGHLVVGTYDRRLAWMDMEMSSTPFRTMRYHERGVRAVEFHRGGLPLLADSSDDGALQIYFARVYSDSLDPPTIVPVKKLVRGGHGVVDSIGVLDISWHPREAWIVSAGADGTCRLWM